VQADHGGYHGYAADQEDPDYGVCKMSVLEIGFDMFGSLTLSSPVDLKSQCWLYG
jgi:hypothetical protein